jgi:hypothetical protein
MEDRDPLEQAVLLILDIIFSIKILMLWAAMSRAPHNIAAEMLKNPNKMLAYIFYMSALIVGG